MGLIQQAQRLTQFQLGNITTGWATPVTWTNGTVTVVCNAFAIAHSTAMNVMTGAPERGLTARVTVSEASLVTLNYPVRDSEKRCILKGHRVTWTDVTGREETYIINEIRPDGTNGNIVCTLGLYK